MSPGPTPGVATLPPQSAFRAAPQAPPLPRREPRLVIRPGRIELWITAAAILSVCQLDARFGDLNFTLSDLFFSLSLIILMCTRQMPRLPLGAATGLWYLAFTLLFLGLLASSVVNGDIIRGLVVGFQYIFAFIMLPFVLAGRDDRITTRFMLLFVAGMLLVVLFGLWFYYFAYVPGESYLLYRYVSGSGRLASVLANANAFANMIALTAPCVLFLWLSGRLRGYLAVPVLIVLGWGLVLSSSASGLATTTFGITAFLALSRDPKIYAWSGAIVAVAVIGLLFGWGGDFLPQTFERRVLGPLMSGSVEDVGTADVRLQLMEETYAMVHETMLLGLGADQFRVHSDHGAPVHNVYLLLWAEGGLPTLVGWLALLATAFGAGLWAWIRPASRLAGALGMTIPMVFSIVSFTNAHMYGRFWMVPLLLAMTFSTAAVATPRLAASRSRHRRVPRENPGQFSPHELPLDFSNTATKNTRKSPR